MIEFQMLSLLLNAKSFILLSERGRIYEILVYPPMQLLGLLLLHRLKTPALLGWGLRQTDPFTIHAYYFDR